MDFKETLVKQLNKQLFKGRYCDIDIYVENKRFVGHKCILAALSPLLEQHIEEAEKEYFAPDELHKSKIELSGISAVGFEVLFKYMYSGDLQITDENANDVTVTAMILGIQPAMEACVQFKRKNFAASSLPVNFQSRLALDYSSSETSASTTDFASTLGLVGDSSANPPVSAADFVSSLALIGHSSTDPSASACDIATSLALRVNEIKSCAIPKLEALDFPNPPSDVEETVLSASSSVTKPSPEHQNEMENSSSTQRPNFSTSPGAVLQSFDQLKNNPLALPTLLSSFNQVSTSTTSVSKLHQQLPFTFDFNASLKSTSSSESLGNSYREETDANGETVWRCTVCDKLFRKLSYLKYVHVRLHNGNRPYVCVLCGKPFATKGNLLQHNKTHLARNGVLPHKCRFCKRAFALKGNCQKHEKTHTKPYRCEFCPRVFSVKADCLQHHRKHHEGVDTSEVGLKCFKCAAIFPSRFGKEYLTHQCNDSSEQ